MPLINVKLIEDVFTPEQKGQIVERLTDAMVSIEGENMRGVTWVVVEEVHSGDWGIGGKALTTARRQGARRRRAGVASRGQRSGGSLADAPGAGRGAAVGHSHHIYSRARGGRRQRRSHHRGRAGPPRCDHAGRPASRARPPAGRDARAPARGGAALDQRDGRQAALTALLRAPRLEADRQRP